MDDYLSRVDVAALESCLTSKESRAVRRGAVGKVPAQVTRRPPTLPLVRLDGGLLGKTQPLLAGQNLTFYPMNGAVRLLSRAAE